MVGSLVTVFQSGHSSIGSLDSITAIHIIHHGDISIPRFFFLLFLLLLLLLELHILTFLFGRIISTTHFDRCCCRCCFGSGGTSGWKDRELNGFTVRCGSLSGYRCSTRSILLWVIHRSFLFGSTCDFMTLCDFARPLGRHFPLLLLYQNDQMTTTRIEKISTMFNMECHLGPKFLLCL